MGKEDEDKNKSLASALKVYKTKSESWQNSV